jgi:ribosomal protein S18 acetylase RimI-like enzyme
MAVEIREALPGAFTPDELARLGEIVFAAYEAIGALEGDDEYVPELRDVERRAREAVVLVARDATSGELLGCVTYVPDGSSPWAEHLEEGEAAIRMLAVAPAAQGRGAGTALVAACLERARAAGRRAVFLHSLPVMTEAQRIYARFGFGRVPGRDWRVDGLLLMGYLLDLR